MCHPYTLFLVISRENKVNALLEAGLNDGDQAVYVSNLYIIWLCEYLFSGM